MSIIKSSRTRNAFPLLFDDFFNRDLFDWSVNNFSTTGTTVPAVNIKETADNFQVELASPGMQKKDFKVELEGNVLTISSEKRKEIQEGSENEKYTRKEFSYESFSRSFTLPKDVVDADKIIAKYEEGMLSLLIPKKEEVKQKAPKMIQIS